MKPETVFDFDSGVDANGLQHTKVGKLSENIYIYNCFSSNLLVKYKGLKYFKTDKYLTHHQQCEYVKSQNGKLLTVNEAK